MPTGCQRSAATNRGGASCLIEKPDVEWYKPPGRQPGKEAPVVAPLLHVSGSPLTLLGEASATMLGTERRS